MPHTHTYKLELKLEHAIVSRDSHDPSKYLLTQNSRALVASAVFVALVVVEVVVAVEVAVD